MNIVVATDLSDGSIPAARWGFDFVDHAEQSGESVETHIVNAIEARYPQILDLDLRLSERKNREELEQNIRQWVHDAFERETDYTPEVVEGRPAEALQETVEEHDADWLAVGMTGRGAISRMVVGSTAEELTHGPPCNMVVAHPKRPIPRDNPTFLVGIDFTDAAARAVELGADLARTYGGEIRIVHSVEPPSYDAYPIDTFDEGVIQNMDDLVEQMNEEVETFVSDHDDKLEGVDWQTDTITGYPTNELVRYAEDNDLDGIVVGTVGRTAMGDFLMGSVSRGVVKHMPCSVYLTPPK